MSRSAFAAIMPAVVAFTVSSLVSSTAYSAQRLNNPLTPSYFSVKTDTDRANASGTQYVDRHNPLRPAHFTPENWIETGTRESTPSYFVPNNPLHPTYKRL
jgi:hypothetical protein